jgi:hypothetical protein
LPGLALNHDPLDLLLLIFTCRVAGIIGKIHKVWPSFVLIFF